METLKKFAIDSHITFEPLAEGLPPRLVLSSEKSRCSISLYGGQVLSFVPNHSPDLLWVSEKALFQPGKAIRGGIPVCWPWFGPHPADASKPSHGFARLREWHVETTGMDDGAPFALLTLEADEASRRLFDFDFRLELRVRAAEELAVSLTTVNRDTRPFSLSEALHTYLDVSDIAGVTIGGMEGVRYLDQLQGNASLHQNGPIRFAGELDRVYLDTENDAILEDGPRRIGISKSGSRSTVIWNPWIAKAKAMSDFGDDEYRGMVCIETANAAENIVTVGAGERHTLTAIIKECL